MTGSRKPYMVNPATALHEAERAAISMQNAPTTKLTISQEAPSCLSELLATVAFRHCMAASRVLHDVVVSTPREQLLEDAHLHDGVDPIREHREKAQTRPWLDPTSLQSFAGTDTAVQSLADSVPQRHALGLPVGR